MRPEASEPGDPGWRRLGIRVDDLREASRLAGSLRRGAVERRRALMATAFAPSLALLLATLLAVVMLRT